MKKISLCVLIVLISTFCYADQNRARFNLASYWGLVKRGTFAFQEPGIQFRQIGRTVIRPFIGQETVVANITGDYNQRFAFVASTDSPVIIELILGNAHTQEVMLREISYSGNIAIYWVADNTNRYFDVTLRIRAIDTEQKFLAFQIVNY